MDEEEYGRLLEPLLYPAAGYACSILRDRHQAQDAVQQAALRGLERIRTFDASRPFKGWWFAILRHCCIDMLRELKAPKVVRLGGVDPPAAARGDADDDVEDWERLSACMLQLSADHQEILRLKYFGGLRYREIAEALSIPQGTVMSRLHLARQTLAAKMREEKR
jgi:RNA polymerase sigma-70 factor (ECF subfamily)